jgi:hypothetical protein
MDEKIETFVAELEKSLANAAFIKLILSNYKGADGSLQKISVRPIEIKKGSRLMFQSRFDTRDVVKNFNFPEGVDEVRSLLQAGFRNAHLFTTERDFQLDIGKRSSRLKAGRPENATRSSFAHDRKKRTIIDPNAFYLKALGIASDNGEIKPSQQDKWRQINKFIEILASLIDVSAIRDKQDLNIVDMGAGKGYLTFAAYDFLSNIYRVKTGSSSDWVLPAGQDLNPTRVQMTGVEARAELVDLCSDIAKAGGFDGLKFVRGTIADFDTDEIDILIALHACDTATDDALYKGIAANASIIVAAPCCHKELRKQITSPSTLAGILKHGIMLERTAETITDGLRALLLERSGYSTKVFEFVPTEHTPKNNMLVAVRHPHRRGAQLAAKQIDEIKATFDIREQHLDRLLE